MDSSYISQLPSEQWAQKWPRKICLLGCTGSIGKSTLDIIRKNQGDLNVFALGAGKNITLLAKIASEFRPPYLAVQCSSDIENLKKMLPQGYFPEILEGQDGYEIIASLPQVDIVLSAQSGAAGLCGTLAAINAGKLVALANKESLVMAGELVRNICKKTGAIILPVDSEHNALFQCLAGNKIKEVSRLTLTASGGPFFGKKKEELALISPKQALNHPNWSMGAKITIDSATLMNKGLEVIEACHLYGISIEQVEVVVHRQSLVHSLVVYIDGAQLAQLSVPDMRMAIGNCLFWPLRKPSGIKDLDLTSIGSITFSRYDGETFPCLDLAKKAFKHGQGCPIVLNAANEIAVEAFLSNDIKFLDISHIVSQAIDWYLEKKIEIDIYSNNALSNILDLDNKTRVQAKKYINQQTLDAL